MQGSYFALDAYQSYFLQITSLQRVISGSLIEYMTGTVIIYVSLLYGWHIALLQRQMHWLCSLFLQGYLHDLKWWIWIHFHSKHCLTIPSPRGRRCTWHQLLIVLLNAFSPWTQNISGCQNAHSWEIAQTHASPRCRSPLFGQQVMPLVPGEDQRLQCWHCFGADPLASMWLMAALTCDYLCSAFFPEGFKSLYQADCYTLLLWWFCEKGSSSYGQDYLRWLLISSDLSWRTL